MKVFSVPGRPMEFKDCHMRSDPSAAQTPVAVAANCLLVKNAGLHGNLTILCDSGPGIKFAGKLGIKSDDVLLQNLARAGVTPADIDVYLPSHLHWDHSGWAWEGGVFKLPKAHVIMSREARADNARATTGDRSFLPEVPGILDGLDSEGRLTLLDAKDVSLTGPGTVVDRLGDQVRFFFSRGHSEGQMHAVFTTASGTIVFGGDFWPTAWHGGNPARYMPLFDQRDTAQLLRDKAAFLPRVAQNGWHLYFYHDPVTLAGQVVADGDGYKLQNGLTEVCWT